MRAGGGTSAAVTWWDLVFGGVGTKCLSEEVKGQRPGRKQPFEEFHCVSQCLPRRTNKRKHNVLSSPVKKNTVPEFLTCGKVTFPDGQEEELGNGTNLLV